MSQESSSPPSGASVPSGGEHRAPAPAPAPAAKSPATPKSPSTAPRRNRSRLSFFTSRSGPTVDPLLAPLLETMTAISPKESPELVRRAYTVA